MNNHVYEEIDNRVMKDIIFRAIVLINQIEDDADRTHIKVFCDDLKNSIEAYYKIMKERSQ